MADEQPAAPVPDPEHQAQANAAAVPTADKSIEAEQAKIMKVTSFQGWLSLAIVGSSIVALIIWGIVGSIPERIEGQGIVIRGGGLRQLRASGGGTLTKLTIKTGDDVKDGQIVGEITQVGSSEEIKTTRQN